MNDFEARKEKEIVDADGAARVVAAVQPAAGIAGNQASIMDRAKSVRVENAVGLGKIEEKHVSMKVGISLEEIIKMEKNENF